MTILTKAQGRSSLLSPSNGHCLVSGLLLLDCTAPYFWCIGRTSSQARGYNNPPTQNVFVVRRQARIKRKGNFISLLEIYWLDAVLWTNDCLVAAAQREEGRIYNDCAAAQRTEEEHGAQRNGKKKACGNAVSSPLLLLSDVYCWSVLFFQYSYYYSLCSSRILVDTII